MCVCVCVHIDTKHGRQYRVLLDQDLVELEKYDKARVVVDVTPCYGLRVRAGVGEIENFQ